MAVGALIGAYQEDDSGGLRALLPLAGRTLVEYQVRCASAAGAAPIVVVVERVPQALQDAFERLRLDGDRRRSRSATSTKRSAGSRPARRSCSSATASRRRPSWSTQLADEPEPAVATVPDDEQHEAFERIDAGSRWAGVAMVDAAIARLDRGDAWRLGSAVDLAPARDPGRRAAAAGVARPAANPCWSRAPSSWPASSACWSRRRAALGPTGPAAIVLPLGRGTRHRAADGNAGPAALAGLGGARPDAWRRLLLQPRLARRGPGPARPLDAARPDRRAPGEPAPASRCRHGCCQPACAVAGRRPCRCLRSAGGRCATARLGCTGYRRLRPVPSPRRRGSRKRRCLRVAICGCSRAATRSSCAIPFALAGTWTAYLLGLLAYAAMSFFIVQHVRHSASRVDAKLTEIG